eukprot:1517399-Pyramimonas_sp.AAC.1
MKTVEDAHAVTWVVFEQFLQQIPDFDGDDDATKSRLIAEGNRLNAHRIGPADENQQTIEACKTFFRQNVLDRVALGHDPDDPTAAWRAAVEADQPAPPGPLLEPLQPGPQPIA